jgi:signal transduction histidine kinase
MAKPNEIGEMKPRIAAMRTVVLRYGFVALVTLSVLLPFHAWRNVQAETIEYILASAVVAFSAWYVGIGPAVFSVSIVVGIQYWFVSQELGLSLRHGLIVLVFVLGSSAVLVMAERRRRLNESLKRGQAELELRVKERTAQLDLANSNLRDLSARLLQLQDDERRRIARELHDSVGQLLVGLSLNMSTVRAEIERLTKAAAVLSDSENLIQEMSKEVRTISHLLHPPLLDEAGLASGIRWYIDGFAQRSHIKVELDCPTDFGRLPRDIETAMFRVVQESLTNIHRHSGSLVAKIRCQRVQEGILVEVQDHGTGIPAEKIAVLASVGTPGVGIRGMRERVRQLGGDLEIRSDSNGTIVAARLPVLESLLANSSDHDASKTAAA